MPLCSSPPVRTIQNVDVQSAATLKDQIPKNAVKGPLRKPIFFRAQWIDSYGQNSETLSFLHVFLQIPSFWPFFCSIAPNLQGFPVSNFSFNGLVRTSTSVIREWIRRDLLSKPLEEAEQLILFLGCRCPKDPRYPLVSHVNFCQKLGWSSPDEVKIGGAW
jgi:hypothetical protein